MPGDRFRRGGGGQPGPRGPGGWGRGGGPPQPPERTLEEIWPAYLKGGYFDDAGHLRLDYVSRDRVEPLVREMSQARPSLTMHQVRRFFQHCRAIEARLRSRRLRIPAILNSESGRS